MDQAVFLPGPVNLHPDVLADLACEPVHHRTEAFKRILAETSAMLCAMTGARHAALLPGSGTLANEIVAMQLKGMGGYGLIASNGEFGERLADQAQRAGLSFTHLRHPWGHALNYDELERRLMSESPGWLWFTHLETSTGVFNDLPLLASLCQKTGIRLCVDAISSIGNAPVDLSPVRFATASSGKGLASIAGIAIVLHSRIPQPDPCMPRYLDLGFHALQDGIPFTFPSNLLQPLWGELNRMQLPERVEQVLELSGELDRFLLGRGLSHVTDGAQRAPFMLTYRLPDGQDSVQMGAFFDAKGVRIHYKSTYLIKRNWIQLALMGYPGRHAVEHFRRVFDEWTER